MNLKPTRKTLDSTLNQLGIRCSFGVQTQNTLYKTLDLITNLQVPIIAMIYFMMLQTSISISQSLGKLLMIVIITLGDLLIIPFLLVMNQYIIMTSQWHDGTGTGTGTVLNSFLKQLKTNFNIVRTNAGYPQRLLQKRRDIVILKVLFGLIYIFTFYCFAGLLSKELLEISIFLHISISIILGFLFGLPSFLRNFKNAGIWVVDWYHLGIVIVPIGLLYICLSSVEIFNYIIKLVKIDPVTLTSPFFLTISSFIFGFTLTKVIEKKS